MYIITKYNTISDNKKNKKTIAITTIVWFGK
jgi:hypothetical protein